ncbi:hypothetical protein SESBI_08147 [Sesbania bispinosa]|nr:hypothetical protein SESBI_08147 [Sesbania bispinosa]
MKESLKSAEAELKKVDQLKLSLKAAEEEMKKVDQLKVNLKTVEVEKAELLKEKTTWDEKLIILEKEKTTLTATNEKLESDLVEARAEVAMQHTAGFEKALSQIQFLHPDIQVGDMGVFKHVVDVFDALSNLEKFSSRCPFLGRRSRVTNALS